MSATFSPTHHPDPRPLANADVLQLHTFHETHGGCFAFSPHGATLAFCVQRPLAQTTRHADFFFSGIAHGELFTADLATLQVRRLELPLDCFAPAWAPCGNYLVFGLAAEDGTSVRVGWVHADAAVTGGAQQPTIPNLGQLQLLGMRPFEWIGDGLLACACVPDGGMPWLAGLDSRGVRKAAAFWQALDAPGQPTVSVLASAAVGAPKPMDAQASIGLAHLPRELVVYDLRQGRCLPLAEHADNPALIAFGERLASGHQAALERRQLAWSGEAPAAGSSELVAVHSASGQALFLVQDGLGSHLVLAGQGGAAAVRGLFDTNTHLAGCRRARCAMSTSPAAMTASRARPACCCRRPVRAATRPGRPWPGCTRAPRPTPGRAPSSACTSPASSICSFWRRGVTP